ncbi:MAG: peroxiredoxin [Candidatus Limnocylindrales bacterium]
MTSESIAPAQPEVGTLAPDFTLPDDAGAMRTLSDERGHWVVLWFYPKDNTPGCTREACSFRDASSAFEATDAVVWGISVLGSGSKAAFKAKFGLPFTLIADAQHIVADTYGTWVQKVNYGKTYMGVKRSTFLIDPSGRIARVWSKVTPDDHAAEVLAALAEERDAA